MDWEPDLRTAFTVSTVVYLTLALTSLALWSIERRYREFLVLGLCYLFISITLVVWFANGVIPVQFDTTLSFLFGGAGVLLVGRSVKVYCRHKPNWWVDAGLFVAINVAGNYYAYIEPNVVARIAASGAINMIVCIQGTLALLSKGADTHRGPRNAMAASLMLLFVSHAVRSTLALAGPEIGSQLHPGAQLAMVQIASLVAYTVIACSMLYGVFTRGAAELRTSRDKMAEILAALNIARSAVVMGNAQLAIEYANEPAIAILGLPGDTQAMAGKSLRDFQAGNDDFISVDMVYRAALETSGAWEGVLPWKKPGDSRTMFLDARSHRLPNGGFVIVASDATARIQLEEEKRLHREREAQAGKVEALGNLAGGIAHDFNNLLGAVLGFGQFLVQDLPAGSDQRRFAERIVSVSQRGRSLVRQILAFSRRTAIEHTNILLREAVMETRDMLRATLPSTTEIKTDIAAPDAMIFADKGQLTQVLVNLCVNGSDALDGVPGSITISVAPPDRGRDDLRRLPAVDDKLSPAGSDHWVDADGIGHIITGGMPRRDCVSLSVTDTGSGIPPALLGKILEPFMTTKEKGKGTGLGLAVVHRIVQEHGGAMVVTTRAGEGTRFEIILPLSHDADAAIELANENGPIAPAAVAASVLVVDDDEAYLAMVEMALRRIGYRVEASNDPRQVREWFQSGKRWDVLVSDQTMPHLRGSDLVRAVKEIAPRTICIICTGFSSGLNEAQAVTAGADGFMLKPYSVSDLATLVARQLAHKAQAAAPNVPA